VRQADAGQAARAAGIRRLVAGVWQPGRRAGGQSAVRPGAAGPVAGRVLARYWPPVAAT